MYNELFLNSMHSVCPVCRTVITEYGSTVYIGIAMVYPH